MSAAKSSRIGPFGLVLRGFFVLLTVLTPLAGVWVASSLAAFGNRSTTLPIIAGVLLFPGLPLAWEAFARYRARASTKRRILTFGDRLILRTLVLNGLFLAVLLFAFPSRAFVALSTRGDWMLDGRHGAVAERARRLLLGASKLVEWSYDASHDNPYRKKDEQPAPPVSPSAPPTAPAPTEPLPPVPAPTDTNAPTPPPTTPNRAWPWPATLEPVVVNMPPEAETSVASVGKYIAEHVSDPFARVKALHDYAADRIAYDVPALSLPHIPLEDAEADAVFKSHKGVCAGYADLVMQLGKASGDTIAYVTGDARNQDAPLEGQPHAWNAAKIEGHWYLLDATWDAGSVDGNTFTKRYTTDYLFTPVDAFVITHFPDDAGWQLAETPIDRAAFFRRPVVSPTFVARGLTLQSPDRSQVSVGGGLDVVVGNPTGQFLLVDVFPKGSTEQASKRTCDGDHHTHAHCTFDAAGTYDVRVFVNATEYGNYPFGGSIEANARP
ncbi:MAG: transglutaminase domain-containing protein [Polyangiaceae bacterium]